MHTVTFTITIAREITKEPEQTTTKNEKVNTFSYAKSAYKEMKA
jgi:hypothetical protein